MAGAVFAALSVWAAITSEGFLEADSCTHYLYARFALSEPHYLVNVWGRPLCTALYAIPAALGGRLGVRLASLLLALATATTAMRIARAQGHRRPELALIFTLAQPMVFLHSFSELTELPFALTIGLAFLAYQARCWWAMTLLVGISPLGRPEGFGFLLLAAMALIAHRKWLWLLVLMMPLVLWNHFGWILFGKSGIWWRWLADNWPYAPQSLYDRGHLLHFVALLPAVTSPLIFPAMLMGAWVALRDSIGPCVRRFVEDHAARCQALIALIPVAVLAGHSLLYWLGKMASNGELRYMLVVAPFWGLLAARGWEWAFERLRWRGVIAWAAAASLAPVGVNSRIRTAIPDPIRGGTITLGYKVIPLVLDQDWRQARSAAEWYREQSSTGYPWLMSAHPGVFYFLDLSMSDRQRVREWTKPNVMAALPGTLLIWDKVYGVYNSDAHRSVPLAEIERAGWVRDEAAEARIDPARDRWRIFRSPEITSRPSAAPH